MVAVLPTPSDLAPPPSCVLLRGPPQASEGSKGVYSTLCFLTPPQHSWALSSPACHWSPLYFPSPSPQVHPMGGRWSPFCKGCRVDLPPVFRWLSRDCLAPWFGMNPPGWACLPSIIFLPLSLGRVSLSPPGDFALLLCRVSAPSSGLASSCTGFFLLPQVAQHHLFLLCGCAAPRPSAAPSSVGRRNSVVPLVSFPHSWEGKGAPHGVAVVQK